MKSLKSSLNRLCDKQPFPIGWYFKNLKTGKEDSRNGNVPVSSGSVRKIPILMALLKAVHEGKFRLDQRITIQKKYQNNRSGCFQYFHPGGVCTLQDALLMMIIVSDNTCTGTLVDMVGLDYINTFVSRLGMKKTKIKSGSPPLGKEHLKKFTDTTTPCEIGYLLYAVLQGAKDEVHASRLGCTSHLCQLALDTMSRQQLNSRLPSLLPRGTRVDHKTGTRKGTHNDAGVIYIDKNPAFILTVFVHDIPAGIPPGEIDANVIGRMCLMCYKEFTR